MPSAISNPFSFGFYFLLLRGYSNLGKAMQDHGAYLYAFVSTWLH